MYYGKSRAIPMTVEKPSGVDGPVQIRLFLHGGADPVEIADAAAGKVDLAGLFPVLWTTSSPRLLYAQLFVGKDAIGAPVVLQPMTTPAYATGVNPANSTSNRRPTPGPVYSGIPRTDKHVVMETSEGEIRFAMR